MSLQNGFEGFKIIIGKDIFHVSHSLVINVTLMTIQYHCLYESLIIQKSHFASCFANRF